MEGGIKKVVKRGRGRDKERGIKKEEGRDKEKEKERWNKERGIKRGREGELVKS